MNCPYCKSSYTERKSTKEGLHETEYEYECLACGKTFKDTVKKYSPSGKTLMVLFGGGIMNIYGYELDKKYHSVTKDKKYYENAFEDSAEIFLKEDGTILVKQKRYLPGYPTFVETTTIPKITVDHTVILGGEIRYSLKFDSFRAFNSQDGTLFTIHKIILNDELNELAQKSEPMRIALNTDFLEKMHNSTMVLDPVCAWLNDVLNPYRGKQSSAPTYGSNSSGGCYVATAVYGSYDCPEVWTLRRFRDNVLAETWYGRAFIRTYYAISPTLVKWFGHTEWFKKLWKGKLDNMVRKLQSKGFESTPYDDKKW